MGLTGKVAIVTGGSSGIGAAVAQAFAKAGATVLSADIADPGEQPTGTGFRRCDVGDQSDVEALFVHCRDVYGPPDVVFHAAGIGGGAAPLADYDVQKWDRVMRVNVRGSFLVLRTAIPLMLAGGGGSIVLTSSVGGSIAPPMTGAYSVSKAAVAMLVKQAAADYAARGIRVNGVAPGVIDTPMVAAMTPEMREHVCAQVPQARLGQPEEVAAAVMFLASDAASYINGVILPVDGARLAV
jgi:meso-butanediol dehydrogenase/(S,S)-butanediol dehydrogenase/diacetyl reductase